MLSYPEMDSTKKLIGEQWKFYNALVALILIAVYRFTMYIYNFGIINVQIDYYIKMNYVHV